MIESTDRNCWANRLLHSKAIWATVRFPIRQNKNLSFLVIEIKRRESGSLKTPNAFTAHPNHFLDQIRPQHQSGILAVHSLTLKLDRIPGKTSRLELSNSTQKRISPLTGSNSRLMNFTMPSRSTELSCVR